MKNNKAFTLVELLAVIVILAVILVIAVPQVLDVIDSAKVGSLESTAKIIADAAEKKYAEYLALGKDTSSINCNEVTKLNSEDYGTCTIFFDSNGKATVTIKGKENGKFDGLSCSGTRNNMVCGDIEPLPIINCSFDGELVEGAEYVNGQYTYRYGQEYDGRDWYPIGNDGWGVTLTDKESTDPVVSDVCTYINGKPVVSMSNMFYQSKAPEIDLTKFNTSNVTDMSGMFLGSKATSLNLSNFDTSNVKYMESMFQESAVTSLDLSGFNTSNVTNMEYMFSGSAATSLDLSNFDTSNVTDMSFMFSGSAATSLDLSSFDTSNVTDMSFMFRGSAATSLDLSNFDTSNVTSVDGMFCEATCIDTIDISHFDLSKASDVSSILACPK